MPIEITVHGSYYVSEPPELVTVHATVSYEGPTMKPVYEQVARDLEDVTASLDELAMEAGPVTTWSADQLRTSSHRPWRDGEQLVDPVHTASVNVRATFRQFDLASRWIADRVAASEGFGVSRLYWALTRERREDVVREVRKQAVRDAAVRAQDYADALDLGTVTPIAIADTGMLQSGSSAERSPGMSVDAVMAAPPGGASDGPSVDLTPENIDVSASVDARFAVGI